MEKKIIKQIEKRIMGINSMALWVITSIHKETISRLWSLKVVIKLRKIILILKGKVHIFYSTNEECVKKILENGQN
jgi:hypothetical protein